MVQAEPQAQRRKKYTLSRSSAWSCRSSKPQQILTKVNLFGNAEAHITCRSAHPLRAGLLALVCLECTDEAALRKASAGTSWTPYGPEVQRVAHLLLLAVVRGSLSNSSTILMEDEQLCGGRLFALLCQCQRKTPGSKVQFLAYVQVGVQAQQETVVTQFQSLHSGPLSSYPPAVSRLIVFARAVLLWLHGKLGDLETRVSSPALYKEWAAWHEEELRELGLADCALRFFFAASALDATQGEAHDLRVALKGLFPRTWR